MVNTKTELLSPVGSFEALSAAIDAGADSVYFGAGKLNMRSRSSYNFSLDDITKVTNICLERGIKTYLTLNTLIYDNDIEVASEILMAAKKAKISAIIASDISIIQMAHKLGLSVHISVQANVCNIEAVKFYSKFANVIVLARELTLEQIKNITETVHGKNGNGPILGPNGKHVRIEVFVHGALCVSVSGKCYMSLAKYNASANRGACYQNCRRSYRVIDETDGTELVVDNKYIMSPKDICLIRYLDKILDSGVEVLKIEGRGRSSDYVYTATKIYREAIESIRCNKYTKEKKEVWEKELKTVFNRGFWHGGYYLGENLDIWSGNANNQATKKKTRIGLVTKYYSKINVAEIDLKEGGISVGDEIMVIGPTTGVKKTVISEIRLDNKNVLSAQKNDLISTPFPVKVRKNDKVFQLSNVSLKET
jgi:U32 family peptidase